MKQYTAPEMEITLFESEDVITVSIPPQEAPIFTPEF